MFSIIRRPNRAIGYVRKITFNNKVPTPPKTPKLVSEKDVLLLPEEREFIDRAKWFVYPAIVGGLSCGAYLSNRQFNESIQMAKDEEPRFRSTPIGTIMDTLIGFTVGGFIGFTCGFVWPISLMIFIGREAMLRDESNKKSDTDITKIWFN
jgi:tetrahydromethanopterin S-methyltransferase subunit F